MVFDLTHGIGLGEIYLKLRTLLNGGISTSVFQMERYIVDSSLQMNKAYYSESISA